MTGNYGKYNLVCAEKGCTKIATELAKNGWKFCKDHVHIGDK